jgi:CBS domain-containing protein
VADAVIKEAVAPEVIEKGAAAQSQPQSIESLALDLAVQSFSLFCEDLGSMFGMNIRFEHKGTRRCKIADIKNGLGRLVAVSPVSCTGALTGQFPLAFDKKGLFTLAGVIVMLPEERITQLCKTGDGKDAQEMGDAIRESGNLLVGSWDKVFREGMMEHGHFKRGEVFIGEPWAAPDKALGIRDGQEFACITCSITIEPFASFTCMALMPDELFTKPVPVAEKPAVAVVANEPKESAPIPAPASVPVPSRSPADAVLEPIAMPACRSLAGIEHVLVKDIMVSDVIWVEEDCPIGQVFERLESRSAAYALVGTDGHASGIISRTDVAGSISPYLKPQFARWRRPQDDATLDIKAKWAMSKPVRMVNISTPAFIAAARMLQWHVGCLPVADESGQIKGMLTRYELMKLLVGDN